MSHSENIKKGSCKLKIILRERKLQPQRSLCSLRG